jgi:hypothetical protein
VAGGKSKQARERAREIKKEREREGTTAETEIREK